MNASRVCKTISLLYVQLSPDPSAKEKKESKRPEPASEAPKPAHHENVDIEPLKEDTSEIVPDRYVCSNDDQRLISRKIFSFILFLPRTRLMFDRISLNHPVC